LPVIPVNKVVDPKRIIGKNGGLRRRIGTRGCWGGPPPPPHKKKKKRKKKKNTTIFHSNALHNITPLGLLV
jgi:hypothetical protein